MCILSLILCLNTYLMRIPGTSYLIFTYILQSLLINQLNKRKSTIFLIVTTILPVDRPSIFNPINRFRGGIGSAALLAELMQPAVAVVIL